eukprot:31481-Pelagococcus_subviridis.AAC.2
MGTSVQNAPQKHPEEHHRPSAESIRGHAPRVRRQELPDARRRARESDPRAEVFLGGRDAVGFHHERQHRPHDVQPERVDDNAPEHEEEERRLAASRLQGRETRRRWHRRRRSSVVGTDASRARGGGGGGSDGVMRSTPGPRLPRRELWKEDEDARRGRTRRTEGLPGK